METINTKMTKFFAALKIIWELWPMIMSAIESGQSYLLQRRIRNGKKEIKEVFDGLSDPNRSDEDVASDLNNLSNIFRK